MSIYYFFKRRFPRKERRVELRSIFDREGKIPENILHDDFYFDSFELKLTERLPNTKNKFHGKNYFTLGDYKTQFDLRPLRNIVVKQNSPGDDDSSMYEVFNRLNTGGVNLRPQEIRSSMYHSAFYEMLYRINQNDRWRVVLNSSEPDLHMKDVEVLLRGFAMLILNSEYSPSLVRFLNNFSRKCERQFDDDNEYLANLFQSFMHATTHCPPNILINQKNSRFNVALFEATFVATCETALSERRVLQGYVDAEQIAQLDSDSEFQQAAIEGTTRTANVKSRIARARHFISAL